MLKMACCLAYVLQFSIVIFEFLLLVFQTLFGYLYIATFIVLVPRFSITLINFDHTRPAGSILLERPLSHTKKWNSLLPPENLIRPLKL